MDLVLDLSAAQGDIKVRVTTPTASGNSQPLGTGQIPHQGLVGEEESGQVVDECCGESKLSVELSRPSSRGSYLWPGDLFVAATRRDSMTLI
jgi:hypothetical protein